MKRETLDSYMEANHYGISSETDEYAYISDKDGDVVAMYWKKNSVLEEFERAFNPTKWTAKTWSDCGKGAVCIGCVLACSWVILTIFG